jgi:hypothetical protein
MDGCTNIRCPMYVTIYNLFCIGDDCDTDMDGCEESPCQHGRSCTDVTAADQAADTANHYAFTCGGCPGGYDENGRDKCQGLYNIQCMWTWTAVWLYEYYISCVKSRKLYLIETKRSDVYFPCACSFSDINECTASTFTCTDNSQCANTEGSYVCNCDAGYRQVGDLCLGMFHNMCTVI